MKCKSLITYLSKTALKSKSKLLDSTYSRFTVHSFIKTGHILQLLFHVDGHNENMVYESFIFKMHTKIIVISFCMVKNT
jgi:hypothetical protein